MVLVCYRPQESVELDTLYTMAFALAFQPARLLGTDRVQCRLVMNRVVTFSNTGSHRTRTNWHDDRVFCFTISRFHASFQSELIPIHSPLLGKSVDVSLPPLTYMLKSCR